jgi:hypothetical protein
MNSNNSAAPAAASPTSNFDPRDVPLPLDFYERNYDLSRTTLWRFRRAGLLAIGVGSKVFVKESDFVAFLARMNGKTASAAPLKAQTAEVPIE